MLGSAPPLAGDQDERGRTLHAVMCHCSWQSPILVGRRINAHRECDAVFVQECLERRWGLCVVMLENAVQPHDGNVLVAESLEYTGGLGQAVVDTAGDRKSTRLNSSP